jgi:hypothetical protein
MNLFNDYINFNNVWENNINEYTRYYEKSIVVIERVFIKSNIKHNLNTVQKMIIFKFLTELNNSKI